MNTSLHDVLRDLFLGRLSDIEMSMAMTHPGATTFTTLSVRLVVEKQRIVKASPSIGMAGLQLEEDSPV